MRINDILVEFAPSGDSGGSGDYFQALASAWYNGTFDTGSLQKGIKSQQDVEQLLQRGIIGPDGVTRKYGIDYNSTFDGVVISSDDYYEHADHDETDSRTGKPFGPYDYMEFGDEELDEGVAEGLPQTLRKVVPGYAKREIDKKMDAEKFGRTDVDRDANYYRYKKIQDKIKKKGVAEGLNEFAADDGNDGGGEDDALRNYARMWWGGDEATQMQIERALAKMGWEIGEDEGGYDNGGVFVVRAGDENGNSYQSWAAEDLTEGVAEGDLNEKSTSQAQFRTMAAAAHDPKFAKKVGIKQSVAREFNRADTGQDYKDLPKKADESKQAPAEKEADYGADYQDMVKRVKKLAGLGPLKTQYDPNKRVYRNMPTAVQPKK
jgi:hypothetical protein